MSKLKLTALAAVLAAVAAGSAAFAAIPDGSGVIHACTWKGGGGTIRVIDTAAGQHCLTTENTLDWNESGPQGAKGAKGDTGDPGQPGPNGLVGYYLLTVPTPFTIDAGASKYAFAPCPNDKVALSGSFDSNVALGVSRSDPAPLPKSGWNLIVTNLDQKAGTFTMSVVCANAS
jgi:hypothetical protein